MRARRLARRCASALWLPWLLLAACAHTPNRPLAPAANASSTGPSQTLLPSHPPDVDQIPDAVPRQEPRSAFGNPPFYQVDGHRYTVLSSAAGYVERGVASWYGTEFHGLRTATGEPYDMFAMTAAHKSLPLPCYARITNLSNGRSVVVRINDRGPFIANRIIDLSYTAAAKLDMIRTGTAFVQVETITPGAPVPTLSVAVPVTTPAASAASVGVSSVPAAAPLTAEPTPAAMSSPPRPRTGSAVQLPTASSFYIQVGAFANAENARRAEQRLRAAGIAQVFTLEPSAHQALQRVRIGPIASVQQFDALIAQLAGLGFSGARLAQD